MDVTQLAGSMKDQLTVGRVFGEPIERDGVTVIPVASVSGGGGGGSGGNEKDGGSGSGGGFGVSAKPAGVYVIRSGQVSWQPALDLNRVIAGGQVVALVVALTIRAVLKSRARRR